MLQPLLSVSVRAIGAPPQSLAPPTLESVSGDYSSAAVLIVVVVVVVVLVVVVEQTRVTVGVGVAGRQRREQDRGLVLDSFVLHAQPVVLVNGFPSRN